MKKWRQLQYHPNNFLYLAYRYNFLFFQSLIFRGHKLKAFTFLMKLRIELKKREKVDPF